MLIKKTEANNNIRIDAIEKHTKRNMAYIELNIAHRANLVEIAQVYTNQEFRRRNIASNLVIRGIHEALIIRKGIHMLI